MEFIKKYGKWLVLAIFLFIFIFVVYSLLINKLDYFDEIVFNYVSTYRTPLLTVIFKIISFLSSALFLIILSTLLFIIFKNKKYGLLSLLNLIFIVALNQILKLFFSRERPIEWMITEEAGYSFPSGHAMVSAAFYGMLIYLIWQTNIDKKYKKIWTVILSILILLIAFSRIYLGVHYTSDVIAGLALSISYIIIATSIVSYYLKHRNI